VALIQQKSNMSTGLSMIALPSFFSIHLQVCGAINRSLAVQSARSVRVFLVIKEARGDVGNERGRVLLKDKGPAIFFVLALCRVLMCFIYTFLYHYLCMVK
jgi:hypothetical protein